MARLKASEYRAVARVLERLIPPIRMSLDRQIRMATWTKYEGPKGGTGWRTAKKLLKERGESIVGPGKVEGGTKKQPRGRVSADPHNPKITMSKEAKAWQP